MNIISEIFSKNKRELDSFLECFYELRKKNPQICYYGKIIQNLLYVLGSKVLDCSQTFKYTIKETFYKSLFIYWSSLDTNLLFSICIEYIEKYLVFQVIKGFQHINQVIENWIQKFQNRMKEKIINPKVHRIKYHNQKSYLKRQQIVTDEQIAKINIYNLSMLAIINFAHNYNDFYLINYS